MCVRSEGNLVRRGIALCLPPMVGIHHLGRVGRCGQHLCYQCVRIERNGSNQLFQLLCAKCLRWRLSIILLRILLARILVRLLKVRLLLIVLWLRIGGLLTVRLGRLISGLAVAWLLTR